MATRGERQGHHIPQASISLEASSSWSSSLTAYRGPGGAARQAAELRREGVVVETGHLGELMVDFATYGWFPKILPSENDDRSDGRESTSKEGDNNDRG